jgi:hypothetical protein
MYGNLFRDLYTLLLSIKNPFSPTSLSHFGIFSFSICLRFLRSFLEEIWTSSKAISFPFDYTKS